MPAEERPHLRVTDIGEFVRHQGCERRFRLGHNDREKARKLPFAERLFNPLDPVLQAEGGERENEWEQSLLDEGLARLAHEGGGDDGDDDHDHTPWEVFVEAAESLEPGESAFAREVRVEGELEQFSVSGQIDFLLIRWQGSQPHLRVVETKASRKDKTYQRIQVAAYRMLLEQLLSEERLRLTRGVIGPADLECIVARIDESTNRIQDITGLEALNLESEMDDIRGLLADGGKLETILEQELDDLEYQLNAKCDGCVFDVHCLPESARQRRLELLGIDPSTARALRAEGIDSIDALADLDLEGDRAQRIRRQQGLTANLERLHEQAQARRQNLPGDDAPEEEYEVAALAHGAQSQLPVHEADGRRLVRVYLSVDYDYTENRIGALSAHVTSSEGQLATGFIEGDDGWEPDPTPFERVDDDRRAVEGEDVVRFKTARWTGDFDRDTAAEAELIQSFLHDLVDAIAEVAGATQAPVHFYVWSSSEIVNLVEGCSRGGSALLGHLRELLGCRQPLEQLIYSSLREEVESRYALGWTGRGLSVVTDLTWFGESYHWRRRVAGVPVNLDRVFTQNIFDYKTDLDLAADGTWATADHEVSSTEKFEIRSRFYDDLPAPYWHAVWGSLRDPDEVDDYRLRGALERYQEAAGPGHLRGYLRARTHALRWLDDRIRFKNDEIEKPPLSIAELQRFELDVEDAAGAAIDFLLLDQHVGVNEWLTTNMQPPVHRVPSGETIPIRNPTWGDDRTIEAEIWLDGHDISLEDLRDRTTYQEGSWARMSPCADDPHRQQTYGQLTRGGLTCIITHLDWEAGEIELDHIYHNDSRYMLSSRWSSNQGDSVYDPGAHATVDANVSDFVAGKVHEKLEDGRGTYVYRWFDPEAPTVPEGPPLDAADRDVLAEFLREDLVLESGHGLLDSQREAVLDGFDTRVNLIHGPPGTGKTTTTTVAILARTLMHLEEGDLALIVGSTHRAVNNLLDRIDEELDGFSRQAEDFGYEMPDVRTLKVNPTSDDDVGVETFSSGSCIRFLDGERESSVVLIGGTVSGALKLARTLTDSATFGGGADGFQVPCLVVDEASMMVLPHFLAVASLVARDGRLLLAGDHRQLPPIVAHDWEEEDRPPVELYQPFTSAFEAVRNLSEHADVTPQAVSLSALTYTFRLPPSIRTLIARVYRTRDDLELRGRVADEFTVPRDRPDPLSAIWEQDTGVFLLVHDERESRKSNAFEAAVIDRLLAAGAPTIEDGSVAVMTPHRAQRTLLGRQLAAYTGGPVDLIDTVERLQGGERDNIIVSATASDPTAIGASEEFLLNLNRANVAFSRTQRRLVVVCSRELLNHIASDLEEYESGLLWKSLRSLCTVSVGEEAVDGHTIRVLAPDPDSDEMSAVMRDRDH